MSVVLPRPPPPGIVGDVGEAHRGRARRSRPASTARAIASSSDVRFTLKRSRSAHANSASFERHLLRLRARAVGQDRNARFGRIGERESAEHRDDGKVRADVALAFDDHVGVRAARGQQRYGGCGDRHADERLLEALAGEEPPHDRRRLGAALAPVDVRVGAIGNDHVGAVDHALRDVGVQVDRRDDRAARPDGLARERVERAVGVAVGRRDHRAVVAHVDAVERSGVGEHARACARASLR